jgi:hypothetical protein
MEQQEFEIEIRKNGEVKVHIRGVKGKKCLKYAEFFEKIVGPRKDTELTSEFYEPEVHSRIDLNTLN